MADVSKISIENVEYNIKDSTARNPEWNSYDPQVPLPYSGEYIGTSIKKLTDKVSEIDEDFATKNELNTAVSTLQSNFQAGVDACYYACDDKGSTPANKSLEKVVEAIYAIPTGGDCYSMFPQEIPKFFSDDGCVKDVTIENNVSIFSAHIIASNDNLIKMNFCGSVVSGYTSTITLSLYVDNVIAASNIGTISTSAGEIIDFSISYTLNTALTSGYHTISIVPSLNNSYTYLRFMMANFYGDNFTTVEYPGGYLWDGNFIQYFIPSNFISPTNPISYTLQDDEGECGCGGGAEDIVTAMNAHYSSTFNGGSSYNMKYINPYYEYDEQSGDYVPRYLPMIDTLTYNNGKFTYLHPLTRTSEEMHDYDISEQHYFILPVKGEMFKSCKWLNVRCRMIAADQSGSGYVYGNGYIDVSVLKRLSQNTVDYSAYSRDYEYLSDYYYDYDDHEGSEFTISLDVTDIDNNSINFIAICFYNVYNGADIFGLEIDKIWGSVSLERDDDNY